MTGWLTESLKLEIKKVFEPRYKKALSDAEVIEIAENFTEVIEQILKYKWKRKYETKPIQN